MHISREGFLQIVSIVRCENPEWRLGQTLFNVAKILFPEKAEQVRNTEADPFYVIGEDVEVNSIMTHFLTHLFDKL